MNCCPSPLLFGSPLLPPPFLVLISILYTRTQCVRGWGYGVLGLRQINTCRKVPLQVNFFRWRHFALPAMSLIFLRLILFRIVFYKQLSTCPGRKWRHTAGSDSGPAAVGAAAPRRDGDRQGRPRLHRAGRRSFRQRRYSKCVAESIREEYRLCRICTSHF